MKKKLKITESHYVNRHVSAMSCSSPGGGNSGNGGSCGGGGNGQPGSSNCKK